MRNDKEKEHAPKDLEHLLDDLESLDYQRRGYLVQAMVQELMRRAGRMTRA